MALTLFQASYTTIVVVVMAIEYHGPASGFSILQVLPHGKTTVIKLVGKIRPVAVGDYIEAFGLWHYMEGNAEFNAFELKKLPEAV